MLQAILGTHPEIYTCSEPWIALPFIYAFKQHGFEFEFNSQWSKDATIAFLKENRIDEEFYNSALNSFLTAIYFKALEKSGKRIFLDKTPRYYEIISDLINVFPKAKIIILYRHPLAILNSILTTWVKDEADKLFNYSRDLLIAPQKLTIFVANNRKNICLVKYEDLVRSPKTEIKKICSYIGIEFVEEIINYKAKADWKFGDKNLIDKKAPDIKSVDAWQRNLSDQRIANLSYYYLRDLGKDLFESLGYDFSSAFDQIKKHHPNKKDFCLWKRITQCQHIISIEEQRLQVRAKIQRPLFKTLYEKLMP